MTPEQLTALAQAFAALPAQALLSVFLYVLYRDFKAFVERLIGELLAYSASARRALDRAVDRAMASPDHGNPREP